MYEGERERERDSERRREQGIREYRRIHSTDNASSARVMYTAGGGGDGAGACTRSRRRETVYL